MGVDHEEAGALAQRPDLARYVVRLEDLALAVGEDRERQAQAFRQLPNLGKIVRGDAENLRAPAGELFVVVA